MKKTKQNKKVKKEGGIMTELKPCPHCQKPAELVHTQGGYAIICSDHNCLGGMEIRYGSEDNKEIFKNKLISNWNRRTPEVRAVNAAFECIKKYGEELHHWIPVTERLPEEEQPVLVVRKFLGVKGQVPPSVYVEIAERIGDDWCADSDEYKIARSRHTNPTHWMPLPEPPEEET